MNGNLRDLVRLSLARLDTAEDATRPRTVIISGGLPGECIPNCVTERVVCHWRMPDVGVSTVPSRHSDEIRRQFHDHEWTHATRTQLARREEIRAWRSIVQTLIGVCESGRCFACGSIPALELRDAILLTLANLNPYEGEHEDREN